jgi:hypothetical protein
MTAHAHRLLKTAAVLLAFALGSPSALAQVTGAVRPDSAARQQRPAPNPTRGVLGGVPMTAADSAIKAIVDRLDFTSYKAIIKGLTQFGDREQGTKRNEDAVTWIEQQLQGWGYTTERVKYDFRDSPREQVFATKVGSTVPQEMYILGGHMDGRGGGEAANDDASGTALVMEIARVLAASDVTTTRSVRFALEQRRDGLNGARASWPSASLQGIETQPQGSTEPRLGMIQHDMMMWDHGNPYSTSRCSTPTSTSSSSSTPPRPRSRRRWP